MIENGMICYVFRYRLYGFAHDVHVQGSPRTTFQLACSLQFGCRLQVTLKVAGVEFLNITRLHMLYYNVITWKAEIPTRPLWVKIWKRIRPFNSP